MKYIPRSRANKLFIFVKSFACRLVFAPVLKVKRLAVGTYLLFVTNNTFLFDSSFFRRRKILLLALFVFLDNKICMGIKETKSIHRWTVLLVLCVLSRVYITRRCYIDLVEFLAKKENIFSFMIDIGSLKSRGRSRSYYENNINVPTDLHRLIADYIWIPSTNPYHSNRPKHSEVWTSRLGSFTRKLLLNFLK